MTFAVVCRQEEKKRKKHISIDLSNYLAIGYVKHFFIFGNARFVYDVIILFVSFWRIEDDIESRSQNDLRLHGT